MAEERVTDPLAAPPTRHVEGDYAVSDTRGHDEEEDPCASCDGDDNTVLCCCGTRNGKTLTLCRCGGQDAMMWPNACVVGPHCGCIPCTMLCILAPTIVFCVLLAPKIHIAVLVIAIVLGLVTTVAYCCTAFSDPGYVTKRDAGAYEDIEAQRAELERAGTLDNHTFCRECAVYRPAYTRHCSDCGVCVAELDHHCPWTGKCIGKHNLRPFYVWVTVMQVLLCFVFVVVIVYVAVKHVL